MQAIKFNMSFNARYGVAENLGPGVRRVLANNPGPFTFYGTGTFLVGTGEVAVIDPGPLIPGHVENILSALRPGETISHILVTHTHADHSPAAGLLRSRTGAPTFAFGPHGKSTSETDSMEAGVDRDFIPDFEISDGEKLQGSDWELETIHTPGHCSNHLCFAFNQEKTLFCGDHLMAWSTTVILPPDGSIRDYLHSLEKLMQRQENLYWPTHGTAITQPREYIEQIIAHRHHRIDQLRETLQKTPHSLSSLRAQLYPDVAPVLYRAAEASILASLHYLMEEGSIDHDRSTDPSQYYGLA